MSKPFILPQLLIYSYFNCLQSLISIEEIIQYSKLQGLKYCCCVDQEKIWSFYQFNNAAKAAKLIPLYGITKLINNLHWLIFAKNQEGFQILVEINNFNWNEKYYQNNNLIFIHLDGDVTIIPRNFFIANSTTKEGVYIRENKFFSFDDYSAFCVLQAIANNSTYEEEININHYQQKNFLLNNSLDHLKVPDQSYKNILQILESSEGYREAIKLPLIPFKTPNNIDSKEYFKKILEKQLNKLQRSNISDYQKRLQTEIELITKMNYHDYFLIISDLIYFGTSKKILFNFGRGSVVGSLVSYLLGITKLDPLKYNLSFARFLNFARQTTPDIDLDVPDNCRQILVEYLNQKYSNNKLPQLITYQRIKLKLSLRETGKALQIPEKIINDVIKEIEFDFKDNNQICHLNNSFAQNYKKQFPAWFLLSTKLINVPRQFGIHPAGIILNSNLINNYPVTINDKHILLQIPQEIINELHLIKLDLLSLKNLTIVAKIHEIIFCQTKQIITYNHCNFNDKNIWNYLTGEKTIGIFQLESLSMSQLIDQMKPKNINDLANLLALHRPGAKTQINDYLHSNSNSIIKKHFASILATTNYLIIFQEQIMLIIQQVTNYSPEKSDIFRQIISKKNNPKLQELKKDFFAAGIMNNFLQNELDEIWKHLTTFAIYGFNKSHAYAYAHLSYYLVWLKFYYPAEFFLSIILIFNENKYYEAALKERVLIFLPEINNSLIFNSIKGKNIYLGFNNIPNLPLTEIEKIINLRTQNHETKFSNPIEAIQIMSQNNIPLNTIKLLIKANVFRQISTIDQHQAALLNNCKEIYLYNKFPQAFSFKWKELKINKEEFKLIWEFTKNIYNTLPFNLLVFAEFNFAQKNILEFSGYLWKYIENKTNENNSFFRLKLSNNLLVTPWIHYFGPIKDLELLYKNQKIMLWQIKQQKYLKILKWWAKK